MMGQIVTQVLELSSGGIGTGLASLHRAHCAIIGRYGQIKVAHRSILELTKLNQSVSHVATSGTLRGSGGSVMPPSGSTSESPAALRYGTLGTALH